MNRFPPFAAAALVTIFALPASALTDADVTGRPKEQQPAFVLGELGKRNAGYHDMVSDVDMSLFGGGAGGEGGETKRHFRIQVLERENANDGERSLLSFDSPADVKGTALLSHASAAGEDEQWLYLPSTKRVKRIALGNRSGAFLGSEFSYEDLTGADARKYNWTSLGVERCGDASCVRLEAVPKDPQSSYSKRIVSIELAELRVKHVDFFDKRGGLQKTLDYDAYEKVGGKYWRAASWSMTNTQSHRKTVLRFSSMRVATGLTPSDMSAAKLEAR